MMREEEELGGGSSGYCSGYGYKYGYDLGCESGYNYSWPHTEIKSVMFPASSYPDLYVREGLT